MLSTLTVSRLKPPKSGRREVYDRQVPGFGIRITDRGVKSLVSVKGETRAQRCISSESLWKWIDAHGKEFGIGRPYLDKDPPHVGPIDGKEYAEKRGLRSAERAGLETIKRHKSAVRDDHSKTKPTPSKVRSI